MPNRTRNNHPPSQEGQQSQASPPGIQAGPSKPKLHLKIYFIHQYPPCGRNQYSSKANPFRRALRRPRRTSDLPGFPLH